MKFPILMMKGTRVEVTQFSLLPRPSASFILGDELLLSLGGDTSLQKLWLTLTTRFFPHALDWQLDWPLEEKLVLAKRLGMKNSPRLDGDSWTAPLFFALHCAEYGNVWPENLLVSGAVRQCRGLRCASIGRAIFKLRKAQALGKTILLPQSNVTQLRRRGIDLASCVPLPLNVEQCLNIWKTYA